MSKATTNIHKAKHLDGSRVSKDDIKPGLKVTFPSGMGGLFTYECTSVDAEKASFQCCNAGWTELTEEIVFVANDFGIDDFHALADALNAFRKTGAVITQEDRDIVTRADRLGYATAISHTQASWTEKGLDAYLQR